MTVYAYVVFLVIFAISTYYLAKEYGILGVALAMSISYLVKSILETWFGQRAYPLGWEFSRVSIYLIVMMIGGIWISLKGELVVKLLIAVGFCLPGPLVLFSSIELKAVKARFKGASS